MDIESTFSRAGELRSPVIYKAFLTCYSKVTSGVYNSVIVSISGGADSDIMLDMFQKVAGGGGARNSAPFPSMVVIFRPDEYSECDKVECK